MENQKKAQDIRVKFYNSQSVARYLQANGLPMSKHAFKDMVASDISEKKFDTEKGKELIDVLAYVVFTKHPQQINVMDKSNGKTIASIRR